MIVQELIDELQAGIADGEWKPDTEVWTASIFMNRWRRGKLDGGRNMDRLFVADGELFIRAFPSDPGPSEINAMEGKKKP